MYLIFNDIIIDPTTENYTIIGSCGIGLGRVIRRNGVEEHFHFKCDAVDPKIMNIWDPTSLSIKERQEYVQKLYGSTMRNHQIAALLNVSHATVCLDLKHILCNNE